MNNTSFNSLYYSDKRQSTEKVSIDGYPSLVLYSLILKKNPKKIVIVETICVNCI